MNRESQRLSKSGYVIREDVEQNKGRFLFRTSGKCLNRGRWSCRAQTASQLIDVTVSQRSAISTANAKSLRQ